MDEDRGIPREPHKPAGAVETTRAASVSWSNLQEDYERIGSMRRVAKLYGTSERDVKAELDRQGIPRAGQAVDWSNLRADYEELGTIIAVARRYRVRSTAVREEFVRQGIPIPPRGIAKGTQRSQAWREASAKHWNDPAWREQQRQKWLERVPTMNGPATNSPLERLLHHALRKAGISFSTQRVLCGRYAVDILITQKPVVIEADGNTHLLKKAQDAERDANIRAAGYEVYRFTGKPITVDPDGCIRQVIDAEGLTPDEEPVFDIRNGLAGADNPRWTGGKREWTCANCGEAFRAWLRNGKEPTTCSRECQVEWQRKTGASVKNRRSNGDKMRELWADPEWRERTLARSREARWGERQTNI